MKSYIILTLFLCVLWGTLCSVFGVLTLQPILGAGLGLGLQFFLSFVGGLYAPVLAERLLGRK